MRVLVHAPWVEPAQRGEAWVAFGLFGLLAAGLLTANVSNHPDVHTILDTAVCLFAAMLAGLLWEIGARSARRSVRRLALAFAMTSALELFHALVAIPWQAAWGLLASGAAVFRPLSWPPPTHLLPFSIIVVHALSRRRVSTAFFAGGLVLASGGLLALFCLLPPYQPPGFLGVTRPFLLGAPLLWLAAGYWSGLRRADRIFAALVPTAALMLIGHSFMLYSRSPHDTMAMVAHVGKAAGLLLLLVRLMRMGAADTQQRLLAERKLRALNEELQAQYRRLMESNRVKSEFLANMSHELRTPLNAVIGFAELLHDGKVGPVTAQQREFLGDVLDSSRHLLQLINDVLDLSKVEAGKMEFHPERLDVTRLVGEVRDGLRTIAGAKRIRIAAEVEAGLGEVVIDPSRLKQVLYNYLSNALKFTPEDGQVTVRVRLHGADQFRLEVEDTGIGIPPEDLDRLFAEFQQLDASSAKRYAGTGLGLALTKRLVEAQGGTVGVSSILGRGSIFSASLPRAFSPMRSPEDPASIQKVAS